jgi:hypothetical protein
MDQPKRSLEVVSPASDKRIDLRTPAERDASKK